MIALMSERGLVITDEAELRQVLFDCNYYRLSGYFRSFQVNPAAGDNRYKPGTRDVDFLVPYAMDEKLRVCKDSLNRSSFPYPIRKHIRNSAILWRFPLLEQSLIN